MTYPLDQWCCAVEGRWVALAMGLRSYIEEMAMEECILICWMPFCNKRHQEEGWDHLHDCLMWTDNYDRWRILRMCWNWMNCVDTSMIAWCEQMIMMKDATCRLDEEVVSRCLCWHLHDCLMWTDDYDEGCCMQIKWRSCLSSFVLTPLWLLDVNRWLWWMKDTTCKLDEEVVSHCLCWHLHDCLIIWTDDYDEGCYIQIR